MLTLTADLHHHFHPRSVQNMRAHLGKARMDDVTEKLTLAMAQAIGAKMAFGLIAETLYP
jgi:hypothetical protein